MSRFWAVVLCVALAGAFLFALLWRDIVAVGVAVIGLNYLRHGIRE